MTIEIRPVTGDELPRWIEVLSAAFLSRVDAEAIARDGRELWDLARTWGAFEGDQVVGTNRTWATELTVPGGGVLPAAAVAAVAVLPTHRRRGILRRLMDIEHRAAHERGEAVSLLYAAEYPIYGRFGYGPACQIATWAFDTKRSSLAAPVPDRGSVSLVTPSREVAAELIRVHDTWRRGHAGEIRRREYSWDYDLALRASPWGDPWKGFLAVHRDDGGRIDGFVRYSGEDRWERFMPQGVVTIDDLCALNDEAYDALWGYLAALDIAATVKAPRRRVHERLPWLLANARAAQVTELTDGLWVKLLDVPRALAARRYERAGSIVIEVVDEHGTEREVRTRVALDAGPQGATCDVTSRSPDLTIDAAALGAVYLGGTRLRDAVAAAGTFTADEGRPGALANAEALFRTLDAPGCSTFF